MPRVNSTVFRAPSCSTGKEELILGVSFGWLRMFHMSSGDAETHRSTKTYRGQPWFFTKCRKCMCIAKIHMTLHVDCS